MKKKNEKEMMIPQESYGKKRRYVRLGLSDFSGFLVNSGISLIDPLKECLCKGLAESLGAFVMLPASVMYARNTA